MFRHDAQHTGRSPYVGPAWPQLRWRYPTSSCAVVESSPAIAGDGTIYIGSFDGYLYAIRPDGSLKWRYKTGDRTYSSPAIADDGTIHVGSHDNYLYAIYPDGSLRWRYATSGGESSPAIGGDGIIYFGSDDDYLYAIYPDGTLRWRYETEDDVESSPAIGGDGTIYVGSSDGYLYAIHPHGSLRWRYETEGQVKSSPATGADGTIYVGSHDGYLYAIHPDGSLRWRYETESWIESSPAIGGDGTVYVGSSDSYLYAIQPGGALRWRYDTEGYIGKSSPAIGGDGTVYIGSSDGYLYAIHSDGSLRWRYKIGDSVYSSPAIGADGAIYVGSDDTFLYAIEEGPTPTPTATPTGPTPTPAPTITPPLRVNVMPDRDAWVGEPLVIWGNAAGGSATSESGRVRSAFTGSRVPNQAMTSEPRSGWTGYDMRLKDQDRQGRVGYRTVEAQQMQLHQTSPFIRVHMRNYDWVQGQVQPNASVAITLTNDIGDVKGTAFLTSDGNGWFHSNIHDEYGHCCVDIVAGDTVEVIADSGDPIIAPVVEITGVVDSAANTITGQILADTLPAQGRAEIWWTREGTSQDFTTDGAGNYTVDFSPYDVKIGHWVDIWYTNPDGNQVGALFSDLRLEVDVSHDNVNGITDPGRTVTMTLRAPDSSVKEEATDIANDEGQFGADFSEDIAPGDTVEAMANPSTSVYIEDVTIDVDVDNDTVCGTAPPDAWLQVGIHGGPWWDLAADATGAYCADFSEEYDLQSGDSGQVRYESPEGHRLTYNYYTSFLQANVNQSHEWLNGETTPGSVINATLWRDGDAVGWGWDYNGNGTWWHINMHDEEDHCCVDIQAGDVVEMETSRGLTATIEVIPMTGVVDANTETISGQLFDIPFPADVRGEVWEEGGPGVDSQTDEFGNYLIDFSPFDVKVGHMVALWYVRPDGHRVGIVRHALRVGVNISHDNIWGSTAPGTTVVITVTSSGVKGTASTVADDEGGYWTEVYTDSEWVDILPGDSVYAMADGRTATVIIPDPFTAEIDVETDTIYGEAPAGAELQVHVYGYGDKWVTVEPDGTWSVWFGDWGDLQAGDQGEVNYYTDESHKVQVRFYSQFLQANVNQSHDWIHGEAIPDTTVYITITRGGEVIGTGQDHIEHGTWFHIDPEDEWGGRTDIQAGDVVELVAGELSATIKVTSMAGSVDAEANTLTGQVLGVPYPAMVRGEVWVWGGPGLEAQTDMEGRFFFDFNPFDIQPGMNVAAWYIQPDGNWVGAIGSALVYTWTFGDGTDAEIGNVTDARYINATHTYYAPGTYTAALTVNGGGDTDSDQVAIMVRDRSAVTDTLPIDVNIAIERGLRWLYLNQDEETGAWTPWGNPVAKTSEAVLAFEVQDHFPENDPDSDIYAETVQRGLDYLLAGARTVGIESQLAGDPDANENGVGVAVCGHGGMYEAAMFTSALAGSWAPNHVVVSGPLSGWTYAEVMQDAVDFLAYAQTDAGDQRGGWRYSPNAHNSDNSVSQWPVLGFLGAKLWEEDVTVPAFVADELEHWVEFIQSDDGGSGYGGPGLSNVARTGALLIEMEYVGDAAETPRVQRAIEFLGSHWYDEPGEPPGSAGSGGNKGNLYAMYAVKKGFQVLNVDTVPVAGHPEGLDWYRDYATWLIGEQTPEGNWERNDVGDNHDDYLTTAWAILILEPVLFPPPPAPTPTPTPTVPPTATPTPTPTPTVIATATPAPTPVVECYCCSPGDSIYQIDASSFYGYQTGSASDSSLIRVTAPPAPWGWNQPDLVPDGSWQPGSEVWWDFWTAPSWTPLPGDCRPIGVLNQQGDQEAWDGTTQLYRHTFALSPPEVGMQITRAVLEMWSDNKTEWWWQGTSVSYDKQGYIGQLDLLPAHVESNGGTYALAIQNSNDYVCSPNCNPQGTACRLCVTWAFPSTPGYHVYLPLILKKHP